MLIGAEEFSAGGRISRWIGPDKGNPQGLATCVLGDLEFARVLVSSCQGISGRCIEEEHRIHRGRAGRQGDNGSTRFYVSIEDEIMRRSGVNQNIINSNLFKNLWDESMPIEHSMISRSVEQAQVKMEGYNFDVRKHLVEYDDVVNTHRDVTYKERRFILQDGDPRPIISEMIADKVRELSAPALPGEDGRARKRGHSATSGYAEMFDALSQTFPDDVIRRLLRSILTSRARWSRGPLRRRGGSKQSARLVRQGSKQRSWRRR